MDDVKNKVIQIVKSVAKKFMMLILPILIIVVLLSSFVYFITIDDGTYKENDWSSTPYGASQYTSNVSISASDGKINSSITAQELWDKMIENRSRVNEYLSSPEELMKLMNAELVTQFLDIREDPTAEIEWDKINDVNSNEIQGIIKLLRADTDGNTSYMKYAPPDTFYAWVANGNKEALSHFTLSNPSPAIGKDAVAIGDGIMTDVSQAIIEAAKATPSTGAGQCLGWVDNVYQNAGLGGYERQYCATASWLKNGISTDLSAIPIGAAVYGYGSGSGLGKGPNGSSYGHVGIYIGGGMIMDNVGPIRTQSLEEWCSWQKEVYGWGWADGNKTRGTKDDPNASQYKASEENTNKNIDSDTSTSEKESTSNKEQGSKAVSGDGYSAEYTSSSGLTYKDFKQYMGSYKDKTYWSGEMHNSGCGPTSVAILASGLTNLNYTPLAIAQQMSSTGAETLKAEMDSLGLTSEIIRSPTGEEIQNQLKAGKVMLVSVNSNTIFTKNSHIMAIVDINEQGQVYVMNPGGSNSNWYDISELTKGCTYIVVTDSHATGVASANNNNNSGYQAVVATWTETTTTVNVKPNDPAEKEYTDRKYTMTTTNINYRDMVSGFTMPFDYLWELLVVGEDKDFIFDLVNLINNSKIEITVQDNVVETTNVTKYEYTKTVKVNTSANVNTTYKGSNGKDKTTTTSTNWTTYNEPKKYVKTTTTTTKTNTLKINLTTADVWIGKYTKGYSYSEGKEEESDPVENELEDTNYQEIQENDSEIEETKDDKQHKKEIEKATEKYYKDQDGETDVEITNKQKYEKVTDRKETITYTTKTIKYVDGPVNIEEKTDKDADEPNFVNIFLKASNSKAKNNILSVTSWLFELIETNDNTKDMLDLTKYLLNCALDTNRFGDISWDDLKQKFYPGTTNVGTVGGSIGVEWTKGWENEALRLYMAGKTSYNSYIAKFVSEDRTTYYSFAGARVMAEAADCQNFSYGIMWHNKGSYLHTEEFNEVGVNITSLAVKTGTPISVEAGDYVMEKIWMNKQNAIVTFLQGKGITLEQNQIDCLTDMDYQGWWALRKSSFITAYNQGVDSSAMKAWVLHASGSGRDGDARAQARWNLWLNGEYKTSSNEVLEASTYSSTAAGNTVVERAQAEMGKPYSWGAVGPSSYDCSGFVSYALTGEHKRIGTTETFYGWTQVSANEAKPGYVVTTKLHCGIYIGNGQMIHAPRTGDVVKISPVQSGMIYVKPPDQYLQN